jgi:hypothetical protein
MKRRNLSLALALALLSGLAAPLSAQDRPDPLKPDGRNNQVPETWKVRLDRPDPGVKIGANADEADIFFVNMTPGWHITTGPAGIYYHPGNTAEGTYHAQVAVNLFAPGERQREAYGLFIGGRDLAGDDQAYDYFLVRNTGEFLIKRRRGSETETIQDWTKHPAIVVHDNTEGQSIMNTLAVDVGEESVGFLVNDTEVARLPRADIATDGLVGFRINHGLNVHISDIAVHPAG